MYPWRPGGPDDPGLTTVYHYVTFNLNYPDCPSPDAQKVKEKEKAYRIADPARQG